MTKNAIFGKKKKKALAAIGQQEGKGFCLTKKKKRGGNRPAREKWFLTKDVIFDKTKKAPAAIGQPEENGF